MYTMLISIVRFVHKKFSEPFVRGSYTEKMMMNNDKLANNVKNINWITINFKYDIFKCTLNIR